MKDNKHIKEHDVVNVDAETAENELVENDFTGTVVALYKDESHAEVEDQDNNVFTVALKSLTKQS